MDFRVPPPAVVPIGLRAMRAVAESDGPLDAAERETLADHRLDGATVEALGRMGHNVQVEPVTGYGFSKPRGVMVHPDTGRVHAGVQVTGTDDARGY